MISCGIEEFFYLPQVPENNIEPKFNTEAEINIPLIDDIEYYYFTNYAIFYKIYTGDDIFLDINYNIDLRNDYNAISPYSDPANTTISATMMRNRPAAMPSRS